MSKKNVVDPDELDTINQVKEMARLTILSNKISNVQEKNIKTYPFIFFNGVKGVKIKYDIMHKKTVDDEPVINNSIISYDLDLEDGADNGNQEKRFKALENAVRTLLWKDLKIEVLFNKKIAYKSEDDE